jgi:hypothetical protein
MSVGYRSQKLRRKASSCTQPADRTPPRWVRRPAAASALERLALEMDSKNADVSALSSH